MLNTTQLTIRIAAVQGAFGKRLATYATQVSPKSLEAFLGHDPRSRLWKKLDPELVEIYQQLQRNTTADRLRAITQYIRKRFSSKAVICGAFPAISVAVKQHMRFQPYDSGNNDLAGAGTLHLDMSKTNSRIVLDGLARASGTIDICELVNDERLTAEERQELNALLDEFSLPMVIFAPREEAQPLDLREMRQLFADFNFKQKSISPAMAIAADSSDIYIEATRRLALQPTIKAHGGMETKRPSLGSKSTALVAQPNLLRFVRAAAEGDSFTEAKMNVEKLNPRLDEDTLEPFVASVDRFLGAMASKMGPTAFADTKSSVHLSGPGWGALGTIYYDLNVLLGHADLVEAGRKLGEIDWSRSAPFWADIMREKVVRGTSTTTFVGGGHESRHAIRRKAHQHLGTWEQLQAALAAGGEEDGNTDEVAAA